MPLATDVGCGAGICGHLDAQGLSQSLKQGRAAGLALLSAASWAEDRAAVTGKVVA